MFTLSLDGFDDWAQRHDPAAVRRVISKTYDRLAHVLRHAGLNHLKIDRSFITHCDSDPKQKRLLSAMVAMAQELDLKIVAEGVETIGEQCEVIRQGADVIQGYAIARPMPGHDIPKWVEKYHSLVGHARGIG